MMPRRTFLLTSLMLLMVACESEEGSNSNLFMTLGSRHTNISFINSIEDRGDFNILDYLYFYDGGGVAVGDINNDGLDDIFFTANMGENRLYVNRGNLEFDDVTRRAGVDGDEDEWSTGVTMADVDGDGWLDIYVCQVNHLSKKGHNLLYMNNGDTTFTERSASYGLDFEGLSTQAAFFDYDRDGDLDVYLLNHSVHTRQSFREAWRRTIDDPRVGDKLYRNDGNYFTDVTLEAGIYSSVLGYGLGLAISDINRDGWPDIYVGNDFHENDYLYLNNGDGTFSEVLQRLIGHTSKSSMGNDIADFNNDGRVDIVSLDMLPEDIRTYRTSGGADADRVARIKRDFGYAPQYARNTLQLNRGVDRDGYPLFSEIGLYSGIEATDWSWAGLFADLNNDGWKDLFVTNGILRRPNDLDYIRYVSQPSVQKILNRGSMGRQLEITKRMPAVKIPNYSFENDGGITFTDRASEWGLDTPGYSNGAAYSDLDNDGDVDLVVNNVNMKAFIHRNNSDVRGRGHYLRVKLEGAGRNTSGIGAKVLVRTGGKMFYQEQMPTRGFQSSVSHTLHFGLGALQELDSLLVIWPDGRFQRLRQVATDQQLVLRQREAEGTYSYRKPAIEKGLLENVTSQFDVAFAHRENNFADYESQPLVPHKLSTEGPALAVGDVNGDRLDDFYVGGAHNQAGKLFIQQRDGGFVPSSERVLRQNRKSEDVDAAFFDANGDGALDLYVVSGGGERPVGDEVLRDRLYVNDGRGRFQISKMALPDIRRDGCCVAPADYDGDGDMDVFVGSRSVPGRYGWSPQSALLENDGTGRFRDMTREKAPMLLDLGMVTDALWVDINGNGQLDLVVTGEWMPITVMQNSHGALRDITDEIGLATSDGWWNSLLADDFDGDGDVDLVAGNLGANSVFRASEDAPLELFVSDFDGNDTTDPILAEYRDGRLYTWARRDELLKQLPGLRKKIPTHASYADLTIHDLFSYEQLENASRKEVYTFRSSYFENRGAAEFKRNDLPVEVQLTPVASTLSGDYDNDGNKDILIGGNFFGADTKQGRYDAGYGSLLSGDGNGNFKNIPVSKTGFVVRGEVREMRALRTVNNQQLIVVARNDNTLAIYKSSAE